MVNSREQVKKARIQALLKYVQNEIAEKRELDREGLISSLIINYGVSRRTAIEEIDAILRYVGNISK